MCGGGFEKLIKKIFNKLFLKKLLNFFIHLLIKLIKKKKNSIDKIEYVLDENTIFSIEKI